MANKLVEVFMGDHLNARFARLFEPIPAPAIYPDAPGFKAKGGTSEQAAKAFTAPAKSLRAAVLDCIRGAAGGLTADEVAAHLGRSNLAIRPRLSELRRQGEIVETTERRL